MAFDLVHREHHPSRFVSDDLLIGRHWNSYRCHHGWVKEFRLCCWYSSADSLPHYHRLDLVDHLGLLHVGQEGDEEGSQEGCRRCFQVVGL